MRTVVELCFQVLAAAAGAVAERITGLRHKAVNHAVKLQTVVKALTNQFLDPGNMVRRVFRKHLNQNVAVFQFKQQRIFRIFNVGIRFRRIGRLGRTDTEPEQRNQRKNKFHHLFDTPLHC